MKLLIADDEAQIREGLHTGIDWKGIGFAETFAAEDGTRALELFRTANPEIVITDIRMPGLDGLELCRHIRELSPHAKIIILSGYFEFEYAKKALQVGANDYELKPVKIKNLIRRVSELREQYYRETVTGPEMPFADGGEDGGELSLPVKKAIDYIRRNFHKPLSIEAMAAYLDITPNYFSHLFKKETGIPFSEYLNKIRIHEAKRLLGETNKPAYQVMDEVGFRNYKYFVQLFKKIEGLVPSDYRKSKL